MRFRDHLKLLSRLHYLAWRALPWDITLPVKLKDGGQVILPSNSTYDLGLAYEVFVADIYRPSPRLQSVRIRTILDVGANVGHTIVYMARHYPQAKIEAVEPHPRHVEILRRVVALNNLADRVTVHPVAAGIREGTAFLSDAGPLSTLCDSSPKDGFAVPVVDFFSTWGKVSIDLLKLDCEGSEYDILFDPRFAAFHARALVMEWHATAQSPDTGDRIVTHLQEIGWTVDIRSTAHFDELRPGPFTECGLLWAFRDRAC
jgi:FkbM family methyltransferase